MCDHPNHPDTWPGEVAAVTAEQLPDRPRPSTPIARWLYNLGAIL